MTIQEPPVRTAQACIFCLLPVNGAEDAVTIAGVLLAHQACTQRAR